MNMMRFIILYLSLLLSFSVSGQQYMLTRSLNNSSGVLTPSTDLVTSWSQIQGKPSVANQIWYGAGLQSSSLTFDGISLTAPNITTNTLNINNNAPLQFNSRHSWRTYQTAQLGDNLLGWNIQGSKLLTDEEFSLGVNGVGIYNNNGGTALVLTRTNAAISGVPIPNSTGYYLKIQVDNSSLGTSPAWGGIIPTIPGSNLVANKIYVQRFRALLPIGYSFDLASNGVGNNASQYWISSQAGTGKWEEYIRVVKAGDNGSFSTSFHVYVTGGATPTVAAPLIWYIASHTVIDATNQNQISAQIGSFPTLKGADGNVGTTGQIPVNNGGGWNWATSPYASQSHVHSAGDITSGTLSDVRLSGNIPLKNAANTFTASQWVQSSGANIATFFSTDAAPNYAHVNIGSSYSANQLAGFGFRTNGTNGFAYITPYTRVQGLDFALFSNTGNTSFGSATDNGTNKVQVTGSIYSTNGFFTSAQTVGFAGDGTSLYLKAANNTYLNSGNTAYVSTNGTIQGTNLIANVTVRGSNIDNYLAGNGYVNLNRGNTQYGGFFEIFRPNGNRAMYLGFPNGATGGIEYVVADVPAGNIAHIFQGGIMSVGNHKIINVLAGTNANDVVIKSQLDAATTGAVSGTVNYLSKFTSANSIGNSQIIDNGSNVGIGATNPTKKLEVQGDAKIGNANTSSSQFSMFRTNAAVNSSYSVLLSSPNSPTVQVGYGLTYTSERAGTVDIANGFYNWAVPAANQMQWGRIGLASGTSFTSANETPFWTIGIGGNISHVSLGMNGTKITNGAAATSSTDFVIKSQLDAVSSYITSSINGTENYIPMYSSANVIGNSGIFQANPFLFGFGTNTPVGIYGATAHISSSTGGSVNLGGTTVKGYLTFSDGLNAGVIGTSTNHPFTTIINGAEVAKIHTNGNFQIGTPFYDNGNSFQVRKSGTSTFISVDAPDNGSAATPAQSGLKMLGYTGELARVAGLDFAANYSFSGLAFSTLNNASVLTERARFFGADGNFGINNTSPDSKLDVFGTGNLTRFRVGYNGTGQNYLDGSDFFLRTAAGIQYARFSSEINILNAPTSIAGYKITDLANGTLGSDAINLGQANASYMSINSNNIKSLDLRNNVLAPSDVQKGISMDFKTTTASGLAVGTYQGIISVRQYGTGTDFSGGQVHQLGFTDGGTLYQRYSSNSTTWGAWIPIINQTAGDARYLGINATAQNAGALNGQNGFYYRDATNINTGTLGDARLSSNIPRLNADNAFTGRMAIGGAIDNTVMLNVVGGVKFSTTLEVGTSITASLLNLTGLAASTTNTEILTINSTVVKTQNVKDLQIATYQAQTLAAQTVDIGGGVMKHVLTLDCGGYYTKSFKVNMTNNSAVDGTQVTFTNMKAGGNYTVVFYNNSVRPIQYDASAKQEDGSTNMASITAAGAFTHRFISNGTVAIKAF